MSSHRGKETGSSSSISGSIPLRISTPIQSYGSPSTLCKQINLETTFLVLVRIWLADPNFPVSVSWWTTLRLGCSRTPNQLVSRSQRTNQWEYTQASGMLTIGRQEVGLWKLIGPVRHLRPIIAISTCKRAIQDSQTEHGRIRSSMLMAGDGWDGFRRISWYIIIAPTIDDFLKVFPWNAGNDHYL